MFDDNIKRSLVSQLTRSIETDEKKNRRLESVTRKYRGVSR